MNVSFRALDDAETCFVDDQRVMFYMGQHMTTLGETNGSQAAAAWMDPYSGEILDADNPVQGFKPIDKTEECAYFWGPTMEGFECQSK